MSPCLYPDRNLDSGEDAELRGAIYDDNSALLTVILDVLVLLATPLLTLDQRLVCGQIQDGSPPRSSVIPIRQVGSPAGLSLYNRGFVLN
uniref:Uncharacterized protein n=1 Tax=Knipowitschia caucasica TaxID=637954 RepID=A0AAV2KAF2_KNICA